MSVFLSPLSLSSRVTTSALCEMQSYVISFKNPSEKRFFVFFSSFSRMDALKPPYFIISPRPQRISRAGSVLKNRGSTITVSGW